MNTFVFGTDNDWSNNGKAQGLDKLKADSSKQE
jgi:hypothetical protein